MPNRGIRWLPLGLLAGAMASSLSPAQDRPTDRRAVNIMSEGTRLAGDLFFPRDRAPDQRLPAILLTHGWGGIKAHLDTTYAPAFARAGYVVLAFDYRGWGESDSRLVIAGEAPKPDSAGYATVRVRMIRNLVDPLDQLEDIRAALDFLEGESMVDSSRIGIWGTSFSGGLAIWTAAHDPRVKVVVSQVGAMDGRQAAASVGLDVIHREDIERARGERQAVPQGEHVFPGLRGTPHLSRFARYAPVEVADRITQPTLLIDAESEELFDIREHSQRVYQRIKDRVPSKYHIVPGIKHYGIYRERLRESYALAIEWFDRHLKPRDR